MLDGDVPCVGRVGQDLASQERLDAALLEERDLLGVAEVGVGLVLDDGGPAADIGRVQAAQRVTLDVALVDFLDDGRSVLFSGAQRHLQKVLPLGRQPYAPSGGIIHNGFHEAVEVGVRPGAHHRRDPINDVGKRLFRCVTTGDSENAGGVLTIGRPRAATGARR